MPKSKLNQLRDDPHVLNAVTRAVCKMEWFGFTLQRNHVYGYMGRERVPFVYLYNPKDKSVSERVMIIRVHSDDGDKHYWTKRRISSQSQLGKDILACNPKTIQYQSVHKQVEQIYRHPLTTEPFMPMPHPRIPGGSWGPRHCYLTESK